MTPAIHHELLVMMRAHQQQYGMGNAEMLVAAMHDHMKERFTAQAVTAHAAEATRIEAAVATAVAEPTQPAEAGAL